MLEGSLVAAVGREGWGSTPWYRLTPVCHFVSVRASSALHLCPNQSAGLCLPPGPISQPHLRDTNRGEDSLHGTKRVLEILIEGLETKTAS